MAERNPEPPSLSIVAIAVCLGAATYLEAALVEYPLDALGAAGTLAALAALALCQVALAAGLYRRVRASGETYSVFFRRATLVALAAFVALTVVLLAPQGAALVHRELSGHAAALAAATGMAA